jgi:cytochrome c-type biogenesis protein CcmH
MLDSGQTKDQIYAQLVSQYSKKILASPTKKGFDMVAWVLPFAGAILMGIFAVYAIRSRLRKEEKAAENIGVIEEPKLQKYIDKIERELKEYK